MQESFKRPAVNVIVSPESASHARWLAVASLRCYSISRIPTSHFAFSNFTYARAMQAPQSVRRQWNRIHAMDLHSIQYRSDCRTRMSTTNLKLSGKRCTDWLLLADSCPMRQTQRNQKHGFA